MIRNIYNKASGKLFSVKSSIKFRIIYEVLLHTEMITGNWPQQSHLTNISAICYFSALLLFYGLS